VGPSALVALAVLLGATAFLIRRSRASALARLRDEWGRPADRVRKVDAMVLSHRSRLGASARPGGTLDDRTWEDLNLDAVFAALDRTESTLGQHALYHRLRTAPIADHLDAFERLVRRVGADSTRRERAQRALGRLRDPNGYDLWWLAGEDAVDVRPWYVLFPLLTTATVLMLVLAPWWPHLLPIVLTALVVNLLIRFATDHHIHAVAAAFRQLAPVIATGEALKDIGADDTDPLVGCLRPDAAQLARLKTVSRWVSGDPFMLPSSAGAPAMFVNDIVNTIYEYLNLLFLLDGTGVYIGGRELRRRGSVVLRVVAAVGEVDAAISVASVRAGRSDWTRPAFQPPGSPAVFSGVRHPLLPDAVPNTLVLAPGHGALITGSNMSGKSTFLRTVGVTAVLAQTLNTCFATEYDAPVLTVRSCIGRADDLLTGRSYYIAEVEALLALVEAGAAPAPHLFLLDELFRGTNAVERIAAGQAVLRELLVPGGRPSVHVALAATHDRELVDLLPDVYAAHHFGDELGPDGLEFDHRLRPGPATTRNAIALLRLHGASEALVARALACAQALDRQRGVTLKGR
jgi:hypothetical protein